MGVNIRAIKHGKQRVNELPYIYWNINLQTEPYSHFVEESREACIRLLYGFYTASRLKPKGWKCCGRIYKEGSQSLDLGKN